MKRCRYLKKQKNKNEHPLIAVSLLQLQQQNNASDALTNSSMNNTDTSSSKPSVTTTTATSQNDTVFASNEKPQSKGVDLNDASVLESIETLMSMGFERDHVIYALQYLHPSTNAEKVLDWCLNHSMQEAKELAEKKQQNSSNNSNSSNKNNHNKASSKIEPEEIISPAFDSLPQEEQSVITSLFDDLFTPSSATVETTTTTTTTVATTIPSSSSSSSSSTVSSATSTKPKKPRRRVLIELQRLFSWLRMSNQSGISTDSLTKSFGWQGSQIFEQHDVHELNRYRERRR
jgi:hypothetical protein